MWPGLFCQAGGEASGEVPGGGQAGGAAGQGGYDCTAVLLPVTQKMVSSKEWNAVEDDYYTEVDSMPRSEAARGL